MSGVELRFRRTHPGEAHNQNYSDHAHVAPARAPSWCVRLMQIGVLTVLVPLVHHIWPNLVDLVVSNKPLKEKPRILPDLLDVVAPNKLLAAPEPLEETPYEVDPVASFSFEFFNNFDGKINTAVDLWQSFGSGRLAISVMERKLASGLPNVVNDGSAESMKFTQVVEEMKSARSTFFVMGDTLQAQNDRFLFTFTYAKENLQYAVKALSASKISVANDILSTTVQKFKKHEDAYTELYGQYERVQTKFLGLADLVSTAQTSAQFWGTVEPKWSEAPEWSGPRSVKTGAILRAYNQFDLEQCKATCANWPAGSCMAYEFSSTASWTWRTPKRCVLYEHVSETEDALYSGVDMGMLENARDRAKELERIIRKQPRMDSFLDFYKEFVALFTDAQMQIRHERRAVKSLIDPLSELVALISEATSVTESTPSAEVLEKLTVRFRFMVQTFGYLEGVMSRVPKTSSLIMP